MFSIILNLKQIGSQCRVQLYLSSYLVRIKLICKHLNACLLNTILHIKGTVQGEEEVDRGNDGEDNIKEWTGLEWNILQQQARSGGGWLKNLQQCPNGRPDYGIEEMMRRMHVKVSFF